MIGTRWVVNDVASALMMVMVHHFLNTTHPRPADVLHAAQLWMLDPHREVPEGMSARFAQKANRPFLADSYAWAAFTYHGQ